MSPDAPINDPNLIAKGGAGVSIRVLNGRGEVVASGVGEVRARLPDGLYAVDWLSAGIRSETLVRVEQGAAPVEVKFDALAISTKLDVQTPWPTAQLVSQVDQQLRPSERSYRSSIAVITSRDSDLDATIADAEVRIVKAGGDMLRASDKTTPQVTLTDRDTARCYRVRPGRYLLQFRSIFGETVNQTLPALPGRQTTVFLNLATAPLLVSEGQSFAEVLSVGVDPSRTAIISLSGTEEQERIRERIRLAGVLMHDLAAGTSSISAELGGILDDPVTDPLLKLYGACVILSRLEQGRSPSIDEAQNNVGLDGQKSVEWARRALNWLGDPSAVGMPPDSTTACWHLKANYPQLRVELRSRKIPRLIKIPPMLDRAWDWAISRSLSHPNAVLDTGSVLGAGRSAAGSAPWLCWKAAAATAAPIKQARKVELDQLVREVAQKTSQLLEAAPAQTNVGQLSSVLSADATTTALRVSQLTNSSVQSKSESVAEDLALALKLPAPQLKRHLAETSSEIDRALAAQSYEPEIGFASTFQGYEPPSASRKEDLYGAFDELSGAGSSMQLMTASDSLPESQSDRANTIQQATAPGLSLRVTSPDDPQKGRFGGKAARGGFRASASFHEKSRNWTDVTIAVEGPVPDGTRADFYLHDSFSPPEQTAKFKRGRAKIQVTAWGGFTVGVWIPSRALELELDLAEIRGAPKNIRTR